MKAKSKSLHISSKTKLFAVFGHPISHSLSPQMHNAALKALGIDAVYLAFDVPPEHLAEVLNASATMGICGINLTVPLKEIAFASIPNKTKYAKQSQSVNTVCFKNDGSIIGDSTDGRGFLRALKDSFGISIYKKVVFILGCGGAGKPAAVAALTAGASEIILANRTFEKAIALKNHLLKLKNNAKITTVPSETTEWIKACSSSDIVVQATSAGLSKAIGKSILPVTAFRKGQYVMDMIYDPLETPLLKEAKKAGAKTVNGLPMLLFQGAISFELWLKKKAPIEVMRLALMKAIK